MALLRSRRFRVPVAALALAVVAAELAACSAERGSSRARIDQEASVSSPSADPSIPVRRTSAGPLKRASSLETVDAQFIGVVTPIKVLDAYWPVGNPPPAVPVFSRWLVRVDSVIRGAQRPGDLIVFMQPGGHIDPDVAISTTDGLKGRGYQPRTGGPIVLLVYDESPSMKLGQQELLFLRETKAHREPAWLIAAFEGRYLVGKDGSLESPLPAELVASMPLIAEVQLLGLDALAARVATPK